MSFIDFGALKERVSIEQVIAMLGIDNLKRQGAQLRGPCPIHAGNSPREFVPCLAYLTWSRRNRP